jgi:transcriptional regulator with GAF, ATPase, and Fis domain
MIDDQDQRHTEQALHTTEQEIALHGAAKRIIQRTPGASSLDDVERLTGSDWGDLLAGESGIAREVVRRIPKK